MLVASKEENESSKRTFEVDGHITTICESVLREKFDVQVECGNNQTSGVIIINGPPSERNLRVSDI